jgi:hypothetical protein
MRVFNMDESNLATILCNPCTGIIGLYFENPVGILVFRNNAAQEVLTPFRRNLKNSLTSWTISIPIKFYSFL